ncbi:alpha/beta hydrolase fold [Nonomuraea solani]|uniref:Alpha/beta hydrolase fold n=1 Tax=Nonomuraea solani TaxID=1144553 RepID=A0A1H6EW31_9ACTN|nr:alpha/beta fold hydrolase [Nonomuraea solani]SEH01125.1 alpha/beta hydrolase fold [Nonomuraea solani]
MTTTGSQDSDPATWNLDQWADDVHELCQVLGITKPIVLGWSFGGTVAMNYAARHPGHPAKLILQSTVARWDRDLIVEGFRAEGGEEAAMAAKALLPVRAGRLRGLRALRPSDPRHRGRAALRAPPLLYRRVVPDPGAVIVTYLAADERRRLIIDAAIEVIAAEGLARATTRRIAERAHAPLGTIHYCFRSKNEMNMLILERARATMETAFADLDPGDGFEATLRSIVTTYWRWVRDHLGLHLALMELTLWVIRNRKSVVPQPDNGNIWAVVNGPLGGGLIQDNLAAAVRKDGAEPAVPIPDLARFLIHRMDGLVLELAETNDEAGCERQAGLLADTLVHLSTRG